MRFGHNAERSKHPKSSAEAVRTSPKSVRFTSPTSEIYFEKPLKINGLRVLALPRECIKENSVKDLNDSLGLNSDTDFIALSNKHPKPSGAD